MPATNPTCRSTRWTCGAWRLRRPGGCRAPAGESGIKIRSRASSAVCPVGRRWLPSRIPSRGVEDPPAAAHLAEERLPAEGPHPADLAEVAPQGPLPAVPAGAAHREHREIPGAPPALVAVAPPSTTTRIPP